MEYIIVNECDFCKVKLQSSNSKYEYFQTVWNGDHCVTNCYMNQFRDFNTGTCWNYTNANSLSLPDKQILFNTTVVPDSYSCGDGIVEFQHSENCEKFGIAENSNCDTNCVIKPSTTKKIVCRVNSLGKSQCQDCSLEFCNENYDGFDKILEKTCQNQCGYYTHNGKFGILNNIKTKQVYINDLESKVKECSAFQFNVEEKVSQNSGESNAFRFCKTCIYNDGTKVLTSDQMYFKDETFKLCFPR